MAKRKGKAFQSLPTTSSGVKRLRENGRLKTLESDTYDEEKILKDAGLDAETMKSIPESERQAIMKAILESNQAKDVFVVESSDSNDSKELSVNELNEEETQPPDRLDDVCSRDGSRSGSPKSLDLDIPPERQHENRVPPLEICIGSPQSSDESDDSKRPKSVEKDKTEAEKDVNLNTVATDEATQPYQLMETEEPPSILAADTQFSPQHTNKEKVDVFDVIPESPVLASSEVEDKDTENEEEREASQRKRFGLLSRVYPKRSTTITLKDFLPRHSPGTIKNSTLYSQVIKSMFDIYIRRLRLANNRMQERPVKWGDPVKTGLHHEGLLRRRTLVSDTSENDGSKTGGRGRKRIFRRNVKKDTDSVVSLVDNRNEDKRPAAPVEREDVENDIMVDDPKDRCATLSTVFDLDNDSSDTCDNQYVAKKVNNNFSVFKKSMFISRGENQTINEDVATTSVPSNICDMSSNDDGPDLLPCNLHRNSPSPHNMNHKDKKTIPVPDIEILDDDSSSELKNDPGSWLRAKNSSRNKSISEPKQGKKTKTRSDTPEVAKRVLNRRGKGEGVGQTMITNMFVPKADLCQIIEDDDKKKDEEEPELEAELKSDANQKNEEMLRESHKERNVNDDIPSSVDSAYMLNSQGDMYSTQMTKIKLVKKSRLEKRDSPASHIEVPTKQDYVTISSRPRRQLKKRFSSSVEEIEDYGDDVERNKSKKLDILDCQTKIASTFGSIGSRSRTRKRKSASVEEIEIIEDHQSDFETTHDSSTRKSNKKRPIRSKGTIDHEIVDTKLNQPKVGPDEDIGKSTLLISSKKALKFDVPIDVEECGVHESNQRSKRKKVLFDADTYIFSNESETKSSIVIDTSKPGETEQTIIAKRKIECFRLNKDDKQHPSPEEEKPSTSSSTDGIMANEGMCPICVKMFNLDKLEAHAATCGEGLTEKEGPSTFECMICHKEIASDVLKEHQTKCAASRVPEAEEEETPTRMTRAKKSSSHKPRKNALLREKSPSSSGEDYAHLVIEEDKGRR